MEPKKNKSAMSKKKPRAVRAQLLNKSPKVLTPEELLDMKDIPATGPMPAFKETLEYCFSVPDGEILEVSTKPDEQKKKSVRKTVIKTKGVLAENMPLVHGEYLDPKHLKKTHSPFTKGYRPSWLDQVAVPKVWPRHIPARYLAQQDYFGIRPVTLDLPTSAQWPWTVIGKLFIGRRGQKTKEGSAVLVGPNLLLTASHGMPWETNDFSVRFVPNYRHGNDPRFGHAYVDEWRGVRKNEESSASGLDCVICKLSWRIGDRTGWMGSWYFGNEKDYYRTWFSAGYPKIFAQGQIPMVEFNEMVKDIDGDGNGLEIETDFFTTGGYSGGPLWGWVENQPRVIGICSGYEEDIFDPIRSVFAGGKNMVDLVKYGYANWV